MVNRRRLGNIIIAAVLLVMLTYGVLLRGELPNEPDHSISSARLVVRLLPPGQWGFGVQRRVGCGTGLPESRWMRRLAFNPIKMGTVEIGVSY